MADDEPTTTHTAVPPGAERDPLPSRRCPTCDAPLRAQDRFCATCGARLERADLRRALPPSPPPMAPLPAMPVPAPFPAPAGRADGPLLSVLAGLLVVAMATLAVVVVLAVTAGDDDSRPRLVTSPAPQSEPVSP